LACHLEYHIALGHFNAGNSTALGTSKDLTKVTSFVALAFMA
jgi:hypothetical protein